MIAKKYMLVLAAALVAAAPAHAQRVSLADRVAALEAKANNPQQNLDLLNRITQQETELRELRAQLQASGVQLVEPATTGQSQPPADIELTVLKEQRERAVVGITSIGQVRELQLRVRFKFRVRSGKGRDLIDDLELLQERDLSYDEALVLGKQAEEELLYREMQSDIVRQLMRRLAALQPD